MNKELKYLLEELKDTTNDYVGTNGCLYQDLLREEINLLLNYINVLEQQVKKQKEVIDKAIEYINSNPNVFYDEYLIDVETLKNNEMEDEIVGEIRFISNLLDILKEVSE